MQDPFAVPFVVWSVRSVGSGNKYLYDHPTGDKEVGEVSETGFAGLATSTGMMHVVLRFEVGDGRAFGCECNFRCSSGVYYAGTQQCQGSLG